MSVMDQVLVDVLVAGPVYREGDNCMNLRLLPSHNPLMLHSCMRESAIVNWGGGLLQFCLFSHKIPADQSKT